MKFYLSFPCDNSTFDSDPRPEIIFTLKKLIESLSVLDYFPILIFNSNGNRIGGANLANEEATR